MISKLTGYVLLQIFLCFCSYRFKLSIFLSFTLYNTLIVLFGTIPNWPYIINLCVACLFCFAFFELVFVVHATANMESHAHNDVGWRLWPDAHCTIVATGSEERSFVHTSCWRWLLVYGCRFCPVLFCSVSVCARALVRVDVMCAIESPEQLVVLWRSLLYIEMLLDTEEMTTQIEWTHGQPQHAEAVFETLWQTKGCGLRWLRWPDAVCEYYTSSLVIMILAAYHGNDWHIFLLLLGKQNKQKENKTNKEKRKINDFFLLLWLAGGTCLFDCHRCYILTFCVFRVLILNWLRRAPRPQSTWW